MRPDKSLSPFEIRLYRHYRTVHGARIALAFVLTFLIVRLLGIPDGSWPLITLVVVMGPISFWAMWFRAPSSGLAARCLAPRWAWSPSSWSLSHCR